MESLSIMFMCIGVIGIGYMLVFQFDDMMRNTIERRRKASPTGKALFENFFLSRGYSWSVKFLGLILFAFAAFWLWLIVSSPNPADFHI